MNDNLDALLAEDRDELMNASLECMCVLLAIVCLPLSYIGAWYHNVWMALVFGIIGLGAFGARYYFWYRYRGW